MSSDVTLTCIDCGETFPFSAQKQDYFREHNYSTPVRCKPCKLQRDQQRAEASQGDKPVRPVSPQAPQATSTPPSQAAATEGAEITCSLCGEKSHVPFLPRPDRPVYCLASERGHCSGQRFGRPSSTQTPRDRQQMAKSFGASGGFAF
jgi:CxxC-x17-CxxC domain-containing protein